MKTRTYRGSEVQSLMSQIKEEIGDEAVIISMQESKGVIEIEVGWQAEDIIPLVRPLDLTQSAEHPEHIQGSDRKFTRRKVNALSTQLLSILTQHGVRQNLAQEICLAAEPSYEHAFTADRYISEGLENIFHFNSMVPDERRVIAFVGATGVGKTTTIAKLAAQLRTNFNLSIGLISADSYRVGAGYHLQTYASLLSLPFRKVDATSTDVAQELADAVAALSHLDLVLIDTAGCGPRETGRIEELEMSLSAIPEAERMLVLPAPSNDRDLHAAARSFEAVNYSRIVLSKVDESGFIGPAINTIADLGKPLAFITNGQRVPEDIEPASPRRLGWMLTRSMH